MRSLLIVTQKPLPSKEKRPPLERLDRQSVKKVVLFDGLNTIIQHKSARFRANLERHRTLTKTRPATEVLPVFHVVGRFDTPPIDRDNRSGRTGGNLSGSRSGN